MASSNGNRATTTCLVATLALLAAFAPAVDAKAATWKSCGDGSIKIEDVKLVPDPVVAGSDAAFDVAATVAAGAAIPDGSISVDIKYGGAEIAHETVKLCDTTTCPTPATGAISIKYSKTIPAFIPPGAYTIEFHATGGAGAEVLFCFAVDFSVGPFQAPKEEGEGGVAEAEKRVGEAAALVRQQVHEHLELGEASFWQAEVLHKALVEEQK